MKRTRVIDWWDAATGSIHMTLLDIVFTIREIPDDPGFEPSAEPGPSRWGGVLGEQFQELRAAIDKFEALCRQRVERASKAA